MNHAAHILGTVFLCGLWLPVWILVTLLHQFAHYNCSQCGLPTGTLPLNYATESPVGFADSFLDKRPGRRLLLAFGLLAAFLIILAAVIAAHRAPDLPAPSSAEQEQAARAEVTRNQEAGL